MFFFICSIIFPIVLLVIIKIHDTCHFSIRLINLNSYQEVFLKLSKSVWGVLPINIQSFLESFGLGKANELTWSSKETLCESLIFLILCNDFSQNFSSAFTFHYNDFHVSVINIYAVAYYYNFCHCNFALVLILLELDLVNLFI